MTDNREPIGTAAAVPDWVYMADVPPEDPPHDLEEDRGLWLGVALLALAFALGLAVGWWLS